MTAAEDLSTTAPRNEGMPKERSWGEHPTVVVASLVIAVVSLGVSGYTLYANRSVSVHATAEYADPWRTMALQVGLVNRSDRGTNIVSGRLLLDSTPVADVARVLAPPPSPNDPRHDADVLGGAAVLPYPLQPGQGLAALLTFEPLEPEPDGTDPDPALVLFNRALAQPPDIDFTRETLTIVLELEPGGTVETEVRPPSPGRLPTEFVDEDTTPGWHAHLALDTDGRVTLIGLTPGDSGEPSGVALLEVWREGEPTPLHAARQPLLSTQGADFPLPPLSDASYRWSISVGGRTVSIGQFLLPCPDQDTPGPGPGTNGQVLADACRP